MQKETNKTAEKKETKRRKFQFPRLKDANSDDGLWMYPVVQFFAVIIAGVVSAYYIANMLQTPTVIAAYETVESSFFTSIILFGLFAFLTALGTMGILIAVYGIVALIRGGITLAQEVNAKDKTSE